MKKIFFLILIILVSYISNAKHKREIIVSAANSLIDVMENIHKTYIKDNSDTSVLLSYSSSGVIKNQILNGAKIDIFIFASIEFGKELADRGFLSSDKLKTFCENSIVAVSLSKNNISSLSGFHSILDSRIKRIACGNFGTVPAGGYSKEIFIELGIFDAIKNKIIFTETVRQALFYLESGNCDVALIFRTDYLTSKDRLTIIAEKGIVNGKKIVFCIGLTKIGEENGVAVDYYNFLLSNKAKKILKETGFILE